jgi:hypothetical protein
MSMRDGALVSQRAKDDAPDAAWPKQISRAMTPERAADVLSTLLPSSFVICGDLT